MAFLKEILGGKDIKKQSYWLGLGFTALLAILSIYLSSVTLLKSWGLSALTLAIIIGIILGNTSFNKVAIYTAIGVDFSKNKLLRLGIILYGFKITFQEITLVGWVGICVALLVVITTFLLSLIIGKYLLKLDLKTTILIGFGASICGAAAVMAAEPVVRAKPYQVSIAVATVVVFGTVAMFLYPFIYSWMTLSENFYGIYAGSTIHEVAQVVVAGSSVSETAAALAVIEKMIRVMLLAPGLIFLSFFCARYVHNDGNTQTKIIIPWFALLFMVVALVNSLISIPQAILENIYFLDTFLLAMAMSALGLRTHISAIHEAGMKPILLALGLFVFLIFGGYIINIFASYIFGITI